MKKKWICGLLCLGLLLPAAAAAGTAFPDVKDTDWFSPYVSICVEAGLMNGTDNGFAPEKTLTNGEAAALAARLRERFTGQTIPLPTPGETAWPWTYPYTAYLEEAIRTLGGHEEAAQVVAAPTYPATRSGFMALLALATAGAETQLSPINAITSLPDTTDADVLRFYNAGILTGTDDYGTFAGDRTLTRSEAAAYVIMSAKAAELGCQRLNQLAAAMTPAPTPAELADYVRAADLLCAKHILVADKTTAESVIAALDAQPTQEQFDAILSVLGTDPGMTSNPNGYLFTAGEMVAEFETATRALAIGGYSAEPVQSQFGYHVILRLDPLTHPGLTAQYQESVMNDFVDAALTAAQIQVNQTAIDQIDLPGTYEAYLQTLAAQQ